MQGNLPYISRSTTAMTTTKKDLLTVSAGFRREAIKSIIAIVAFILVYLLMVAAAAGLVVLSFYGGISLITMKFSFITLASGLGIMAAGVMVFVFLVKFLFSSSKADHTDSMEITAADHPGLFEMIYAVAAETGTARPKKVFLSPDVNACVFYNTSFWSMFLPVRKNLKIGLGLVNALNASELKAVIAHEFGHFSQRSMKLGSWVYQVNKIIYDMLFNNQGYGESLNAISNIHSVLSFFAMLTVKIVQGIQWILRQMFGLVNRSYLGLSREMEFHADLVASSVCGSNNIIHALRRIEFAQACYTTTLQLCNEAWKEKNTVQDFYGCHRIVQHWAASVHQLRLVNELPLMDEQPPDALNRVNYKDQWASHPTTKERADYLQKFQLTADVDTRSAWSYFSEEAHWKKMLTDLFYRDIPLSEARGSIDEKQFEILVAQELKRYCHPACFKEYYDGRRIKPFDAEAVSKKPYTLQDFSAFFTEDLNRLPKRIQGIEEDIALLDAITGKQVSTRSFDFEGKKYPVKEAAAIREKLEKEKAMLTEELTATDRLLFRHFYAVAPLPEAEALKKEYTDYFRLCSESDDFVSRANAMLNALSPIYRGEQVPLVNITLLINELKAKYEPAFKQALRQWNEKGLFQSKPALGEQVTKFIASNYVYFSNNSFFENELFELDTLAQATWTCLTDQLFEKFKGITEHQASLLEKREVLTGLRG